MQKIKNQFPIFKNYPDLVYLDSAATSQKPQVVIDAIYNFYTKQNANVHRGIYTLSELATNEYEDSRAAVAKFLNVHSKEIIFTSGTTDSSNLIAESYLRNVAQEGDILITSISEHHSNFLPLQRLAKEKNLKLEFVNLDTNGDFNYEHFQQILEQHGDKVKAIALSAVSNVLGYILDVPKISELIREYSPEAVIIIDAAQAIGHQQIDAKKWDVDFLFFSGHKIFAATGIGILWGKYELLEKMEPYRLGGGMITEVTKEKTTFETPPARFEAGTPNIEGAISLKAAINFVDEIGIKNINDYLKDLTEKLLQQLETIPEITIYGPKQIENRSALVAFSIKDIHSHDVAQFLSDRNIAVRAGHHCTQILHDELSVNSTIRASLHIYNNESDIEKLIIALKECINYYKGIKTK